jgi:hypothetical protein
VQQTDVADKSRNAGCSQFDVPASAMRPRPLHVQINVVDDSAGTFSFPRLQLYIRP